MGDRAATAPDDQTTAMIDEWDQDFLNEAIEAMEAIEAIASRNPVTSRPPPPPPPPLDPAIHRFPPTAAIASHWDAFPPIPPVPPAPGPSGFNFSPPRELSQRFRERSIQDADVEIIEPHQVPLRNSGGVKNDKEAQRLKRELGRISKQLNHLEHECVELKKERAEKDEQLKCALSQIEAKNSEIQNLKKEKLEASKQVLSRSPLQLQNSGAYTDEAGNCPIYENKCLWSTQGVSERTTKALNGKSQRANELLGEVALDFSCHGPKRKNTQADGICAVSELKRRIMTDASLSSSTRGPALDTISSEIPIQLKSHKTVGIQTDFVQESSRSTLIDVTTERHIGSKLLAIWGSPVSHSPYHKRTGRDMVSKLFVTCSTDLSVLFRCMSIVSEKDSGSLPDNSFSNQSTDATKVSRLYVILMKMNNEIEELHHLFQALLDLCTSDTISVVHRSLRILHAVLQHLLSNVIAHKRKNIIADQSVQRKENEGLQNQIANIHREKMTYTKIVTSEIFSLNMKPFDFDNLWKDETGSSNVTSLSSEHLISLFESMRQLAVKYSEEYIQIEVISIMNLIVMKSNPYSERQLFEIKTLLDTLSYLLRKEVGMRVQKEVVHLLFLLLNSPKMLMMLCCGGKESTEHMELAEIPKDGSGLEKEIGCILNGLSECLACTGNGAQELKLRRQVIILLAYMAAYGKAGFEILLNTVTPHGVNFLESIIRVLASVLDAETANPTEAQALCKERLSLMREALILLNRLASHSAYSKATLGSLTSSNTTASLTLDVANRISQTNRGCWKHSTKKTKMGAEVIDLARLFRTRVCTFLGESTSTSTS